MTGQNTIKKFENPFDVALESLRMLSPVNKSDKKQLMRLFRKEILQL